MVMVSGSITKDDLSKSKAEPFDICCLKVKATSLLCVECGKNIHCRLKKVTIIFTEFCLQEI